jgi:hypothetical protein
MNDSIPSIKVNLKYLVIPFNLYEDNRLNATQIKVFAFINSFRGDKFFFSNAHMADMFKVSEIAISNAVTKLQEYGYIQADYEIKAGGGKIRFIKNLISDEIIESKSYNSDLKTSLSPTKRHLVDNDNKINGNKLNNINIIETSVSGKETNDLIDLFKTVNPSHERLFANKSQREALKRLIEKNGYEKIKWILDNLPKIANKQYAPVITTPCELETKLGQLIIFLGREMEGQKSKSIVDARDVPGVSNNSY